MDMLPFVSFVLWSTGLSTAALVILAVADWRRDHAERIAAEQTRPAVRTLAERPRRATEPAPTLLKAA